MELSLRLDTLHMVDTRYLRRREQYRDWPQFQLSAASRQARITGYMTRDVAEQLHQQILMVETAVGLDVEDDEDEDEDDEAQNGTSATNGDESEVEGSVKATERDTSTFSPAFAQALKQLNDLARQRLPEVGSGTTGQLSGELSAEADMGGDEEDALEQLQDAFIQMMEVVRELAEEMSTDALKLMGRFKCARTNIEFVPQVTDDDDEDEDEHEDHDDELSGESGMMELEVELVMVLQLFEEGRSRADDAPAVELQLDVDDFERLHETLDVALSQEQRSRRRR